MHGVKRQQRRVSRPTSAIVTEAAALADAVCSPGKSPGAAFYIWDFKSSDGVAVFQKSESLAATPVS